MSFKAIESKKDINLNKELNVILEVEENEEENLSHENEPTLDKPTIKLKTVFNNSNNKVESNK